MIPSNSFSIYSAGSGFFPLLLGLWLGLRLASLIPLIIECRFSVNSYSYSSNLSYYCCNLLRVRKPRQTAWILIADLSRYLWRCSNSSFLRISYEQRFWVSLALSLFTLIRSSSRRSGEGLSTNIDTVWSCIRLLLEFDGDGCFPFVPILSICFFTSSLALRSFSKLVIDSRLWIDLLLLFCRCDYCSFLELRLFDLYCWLASLMMLRTTHRWHGEPGSYFFRNSNRVDGRYGDANLPGERWLGLRWLLFGDRRCLADGLSWSTSPISLISTRAYMRVSLCTRSSVVKVLLCGCWLLNLYALHPSNK